MLDGSTQAAVVWKLFCHVQFGIWFDLDFSNAAERMSRSTTCDVMTWNRSRRLRNPTMTELSTRRLGHWSPFQQLVPRPNCCWKRLNIQVRWGIYPIERLVISSLVLSGSQVKRSLQKPIQVNLSNTLANVHQLWRGIATADSDFRRKLA